MAQAWSGAWHAAHALEEQHSSSGSSAPFPVSDAPGPLAATQLLCGLFWMAPSFPSASTLPLAGPSPGGEHRWPCTSATVPSSHCAGPLGSLRSSSAHGSLTLASTLRTRASRALSLLPRHRSVPAALSSAASLSPFKVRNRENESGQDKAVLEPPPGTEKSLAMTQWRLACSSSQDKRDCR